MKKAFFLFVAMELLSCGSVSARGGIDPFIEEYCKDAVALDTGWDVERFGIESVAFPGLFIELGVCAGLSIKRIASFVPFQFVYGFDSFEGLPDAWDKGGGDVSPKGSWALGTVALRELPQVPPNVRLVKGWFQDTIPEFVRKMGTEEPIAFLHVDCDLYSSTACALNGLAPLIQEGTIIVFDEFYNYQNYKEHEWKAFHEFLQTYSFKAEYLAYCKSNEQVAVRILRK